MLTVIISPGSIVAFCLSTSLSYLYHWYYQSSQAPLSHLCTYPYSVPCRRVTERIASSPVVRAHSGEVQTVVWILSG